MHPSEGIHTKYEPSPPSRWSTAWRRPSASQRMFVFFFQHFFRFHFRTHFSWILRPIRDPKIDQNRTRGPNSAFENSAGCDFRRFFVPLPFGVALRVDFWRVWPLKIVFPPQREHDFDKIAVFAKTPKKELPGAILGPKIDENRARGSRKKAKNRQKKVFGGTRFFTIFWTAKKLFFGPKRYYFHAHGPSLFRTFLLPFFRYLSRAVSGRILEPLKALREWFWYGFGLEFCLRRKRNCERKSCKDLAQNPAEPWATPPACTNSEGAAVSR